MKISIPNPFNFISLAIGCASLFLAANATAFTGSTWDPQGTTGANPYTGNMNGIWESALWSTSTTEAGQSPTVNFVEGEAACFAVNSGATTPAFTVTMNANHTVAGIFNGPLTPDPCTVTIAGSGILTIASGLQGFDVSSDTGDPGNLTISNTLAGTGILTAENNGQIYLNGNNTWTGGTTLGYSGASYDGIINFLNTNSFGTGPILVSNTGGNICALAAEGSGAITIPNAVSVGATSGGLNIVGTPAGVTFSGNWALSQTLNLGIGGSGNLVTISGVMSGAGALNKFNPSTLKLSGANTYTGNTTVSNGTLQLGVAGGIPSGSGKGSVTLSAVGGTNAILDVNGLSGAVNGLSGNGIVNNTSATAGTLSVGNNNTSSTFTGKIENTGAGVLNITKVGTGTFTMSTTSNIYTGNTMINAGTFALGAANGIPSTSPVILSNGAVLNMAGNSDTVAALSGSGLVTNNTGTLTLGGNISTNNNFAAYSCFLGAIDKGTLAKSGTHTMALRTTNLYNTNVTFNFLGGTVSVGAGPNRLPTNYALNMPASGLFQLDANSQTISGLIGSGSINLGGGTLTINATSGSYYTGTIQNSELITNSTAGGHGLRGYYYSNIDMSGLAAVRDDAIINFTNFNSPANLPAPPYPKTNYFSIRWLGQVQTTVAGTYTFTITSDDGQRLWVNGTNLVDDWVSESATAKSGTISLAANTRYDIVMEYMNLTGGASTMLAWTPPGDSVSTVIPTDFLYLPPAGNLVVSGTSQVTLAGPSTYTGGTTIANGGTLEAANDGALGQGNVYLAENGSLTLDDGLINQYIGSNADLIIGGPDALLNLNYTGTNNIHGLSTDGVNYLPVGTYGASGSGATYTIPQAILTGILNVTASPTTNTLTSSTGTSIYGSSITFTSTITGSGPTPTGTVTLYDGAAAIGTASLSSGQAVFNISDLQVGTSPHSITAVYGGDAVNVGSTSAALTEIVNPLSITASGFTASNRVYNATVNATYSGGTLAGLLTNDTNHVHIGSATAVFSDKNVGTNKTVTITNIVLAGSLASDYTVSSATTTANISNAVLTVTNLTAINEVYNGTTNISLNTGSAGLSGVFGGDNVTLNTAGATGSVAAAGVGSNLAVTITGVTIGGTDSGNYTLTQPATTVTISQASTTNILGSTVNPSVLGASVTFNSTPTPIAPGAGTPTGSVIFLANNVAFSTNALSGGTASSISNTNLPAGTNTITAQYSGDANFVGSTNTLAQVVSSGSAPGALSISLVGGSAVLNWSGSFTLQSASMVNGTNSGFADLPGPVLTGPYTNTNTNMTLFFRLRN